MAKPRLKVDPLLEACAKDHLKPNEVILSYTRIRDGEIVVRLIDKELHRICEPIAKKFGGKGSGSGRTLQFRLNDGAWVYSGEGGWIS